MNMGDLVPIMCMPVLPGDTFKVQSEFLIRMTPLQAPIYQRLRNYTHYFFCPTRLVWDEFKDFITGGATGNLAPAAPFFQIDDGTKDNLQNGTLADYLGLPTVEQAGAVTNFQNISLIPFRMYQLIYNEYYRDQTLTPEVTIPKTSGYTAAGATLDALMTLRKRSWEKDYFTSALPQAQRGGSVLLPLDVVYANPAQAAPTSGVLANADPLGLVTNPDGEGRASIGANGDPIMIENIDNLSTTINDLRTAARLQEWLEKNARGGARYIEQILHHFGVKSSDARLQRPEMIGGGSNPIVISEVLSNFQEPDDAGYPLGTMGGHGIGVGGGHGFKRSFEEHGYIIGIQSVLPKTGYQQGIPRHFQWFDKLDFPWPEFGNLGEQAIKGKELYYSATAAAGDGEETFGYTPRYSDQKYMPSTTHGDFRDQLAYWHQGRIFASKPLLNASFIQSDPSDRIFAVQTTTHKLLCNMYHNVSAIRPLPYFGTPRL